MPLTAREKFDATVTPGAPDDCWVAGRERFYAAERNSLVEVRRLAWEFFYGAPPPADRRVRARCKTEKCCNPAHLFIETETERFWKYVDQGGGPDACWPWRGHTLKGKAYGQFTIRRGVVAQAHRYAYATTRGVKLVPSQILMHRCDNPACCNPRHLKVGTYAQNNADMIAKGRNSRGSKHAEAMKRGRAKLVDTKPPIADLFTETRAGRHGWGVDVLEETADGHRVRLRVKAKLPVHGWVPAGFEMSAAKTDIEFRQRPKVPSRKKAS